MISPDYIAPELGFPIAAVLWLVYAATVIRQKGR